MNDRGCYEQPIHIALANVSTHECEFTRGYILGTAAAFADAGASSFQVLLPAAYLADLHALLPNHRITPGRSIRNRFGVVYQRVTVQR